MKYLLPTLTISTLFLGISPGLAARQSSLYLPSDNFCAVYQGNIAREQKFTLWVDRDRQLTIKTNPDLKVAVLLQGRVLPAYEIQPQPDSHASQHSYRTAKTGNHVISVRGVATDAKVVFCLE